jgi:acetyl-CoA carboxylase beta subunit
MEDFSRFEGRRYKFKGEQTKCPKCGELGVYKEQVYSSGNLCKSYQHFYTKKQFSIGEVRQVHACVIEYILKK